MKKFYTFLLILVLVALPSILLAAAIYNADTKPQNILVKYPSGRSYAVTISPGGTQYFECRFGCIIKVLESGYTKSIDTDSDVLIDDGKLRVR